MLVLVYICNYKKPRVCMERNLYAQKCLCLCIVVNPAAFCSLELLCRELLWTRCGNTNFTLAVYTTVPVPLFIGVLLMCNRACEWWRTSSVLFLSKFMHLPAYVIDIFDLVGPFHSSQMVLSSLESTAGTSSRKRANLPALMCPQPCRQKRVRLPDLLLHLQVSWSCYPEDKKCL